VSAGRTLETDAAFSIEAFEREMNALEPSSR
jgi:hypothetical protein